MGRVSALAIVFAVFGALPLPAHAQQSQPAPSEPVGIVDNPCPPPMKPPPEVEELQKAGARSYFESASPTVVAYREEENRRRDADRAGRCRYRAANIELLAKKVTPPVAVFTGDSITDFWPGLDGEFFTGSHFLGRGIGAQVSSQGLLRFQQDVIAFHPQVIHILYGTNDIAGLGGPTTFENIQNNLTAMVQMARANNIAVVMGTILPITHLPNGARNPTLTPNIVKMNEWIREYGKREKIPVADYYSALKDDVGEFRSDLNSDGVHPTLAGYRVMEPLTRAAIAAALAKHHAAPSTKAARGK